LKWKTSNVIAAFIDSCGDGDTEQKDNQNKADLCFKLRAEK